LIENGNESREDPYNPIKIATINTKIPFPSISLKRKEKFIEKLNSILQIETPF